jgi:hypothetical protein
MTFLAFTCCRFKNGTIGDILSGFGPTVTCSARRVGTSRWKRATAFGTRSRSSAVPDLSEQSFEIPVGGSGPVRLKCVSQTQWAEHLD